MVRSGSLTPRGKRTLGSGNTVVVCIAGWATEPSLLRVIHGQTCCGRGAAGWCKNDAVAVHERRLRGLGVGRSNNVWTAGFAL